MNEKPEGYKAKAIHEMILTIRGRKIILDYDLAAIYGVSTKRLNEQVKRNPGRFPEDFMFQLTTAEWTDLSSQIAMSNGPSKRSQFATASQRHRDPRFIPYAFTEHGALMAANVLRSKLAIEMSIFGVRAFIRMRQMLVAQEDFARKLAVLEKKLTARLDVHETAITEVLQQIMRLLSPLPEPEPEPPKKRIGFLVEEPRASYTPSKRPRMEERR